VELDLLLAEFHRERDHFATVPGSARQVVGSAGPRVAEAELADLAAWTVVAGVLLNLDETLTKE
jgi:hypothetical protein